jgi:DNA-binding beta-propeller fold protein YncE
VQELEQGGKHPLAGTLAAPAGAQLPGSIEAAVSPDGDFAFLSLEEGSSIAVFNLRRALSAGFSAADYVGSIPADPGPVGLAVSPDGCWLYSTSEVSAARGQIGTLTVISVPAAESDPAASVVSRVAAGCNPVRVISSADGKVVWVTARASNSLLASASLAVVDVSDALKGRPALLGYLPAGRFPRQMAVGQGGQTLLVTNFDSSQLESVNVAYLP